MSGEPERRKGSVRVMARRFKEQVVHIQPDGREGWRRVKKTTPPPESRLFPPVCCSLLSLIKVPNSRRHRSNHFPIQHGDGERAPLDRRQREMRNFPRLKRAPVSAQTRSGGAKLLLPSAPPPQPLIRSTCNPSLQLQTNADSRRSIRDAQSSPRRFRCELHELAQT